MAGETEADLDFEHNASALWLFVPKCEPRVGLFLPLPVTDFLRLPGDLQALYVGGLIEGMAFVSYGNSDASYPAWVSCVRSKTLGDTTKDVVTFIQQQPSFDEGVGSALAQTLGRRCKHQICLSPDAWQLPAKRWRRAGARRQWPDLAQGDKNAKPRSFRESSAIPEPREAQPNRGQGHAMTRPLYRGPCFSADTPPASFVCWLFPTVCPVHGFSSPAIGISGKPIAVDSLIEQPCLHGPGRHPFRDLSGSGGFASIIATWLRYFFVPNPKKRLFPFLFGALWFRRLASAPGFALILSYCFAAVHLGSAGDNVGPQFGRVVSSVINVGRGPQAGV